MQVDGTTVIVDDEDLEQCQQFRWYRQFDGGRVRAIYTWHYGVRMPMHQLVLGLCAMPGRDIDHINRDPADNRRGNLRVVTHAQNLMNSGPRKGKQYKGVYYRPKSKRFRWHCMVRGVTYEGVCGSAEEAARAYDRVARDHCGETAYQNFPGE